MKIEILNKLPKDVKIDQELINSKIDKLNKFFAKVPDNVTKVVFIPYKNDTKVELTYYNSLFTVRSEVHAASYLEGIDQCIKKIEEQLRTQKGKMSRRFNHSIKEHFNVDFISEEIVITDDERAEVIKEKEVDLIPMSFEEAVMHMELINHNFFVFLDESTMSTNVVYKRNYGQYGVIKGK